MAIFFGTLSNSLSLAVSSVPAAYSRFSPGKESNETPRLNAVDEFDRVTFGRNEVEPAASDHEGRWQSENAIGDGVAVVMVVEQPSVYIVVPEHLLNSFY